MAEIIGIVASAIAFAQATCAVLDTMNKVKDAPKNIQELQHELRDLETVLRQIGITFSCKNGDPTETVLRSCSDNLKQLHDLVAPFQRDVEENKFRQYVKGLRMRPKESEIENAVKRLQSQKLTLTLALIAGVSRESDKTLSTATYTHRRHEKLHLRDQDVGQEPDKAGPKYWGMNMLTRIIDQKMTAVAQQLRHDPTSKIEDLLDLDKAQTNELWRLDFDSVRSLKYVVDERKREQFLESLCTPDYQQDRLQIKDPSTSTCEWIWDHHEYLSYRASTDSNILHVPGKAGSGKSVLAKHVWKRLSKELADLPGSDSSALLYYCCDKRTRSDESASSLLRALIHQFLLQRPSLFAVTIARNELMQSHSFLGGVVTWNFDSLWDLFKAAVINSQLQVIYCVIDALDEGEKESIEMLLPLLTDLLNHSTNGVTVKLFITSRIESHIMDCLKEHAATIQIDSVTQQDVALYISERLGKLRRRLRLDAEREQNLRQVLVDRAEGMFLWAELAIKDLEKAHGITAKTLANRVRLLPSGLNALYERMLTKIEGMCEDEDAIRLVRKILTWVTLATRPLTLAELRIALAIELNTKCLASVEPLQNISYELLDLCGSFIEIVRTDDKIAQIINESSTFNGWTEKRENEDLTATVRLIHQSAKEYLISSYSGSNNPLSKFRISCQAGHGEIARTCLTYLLCKDFENGPIEEIIADGNESNIDPATTSVALLKQKLAKNEFLGYAALHWPTHIRESSNISEGEDVHIHACKFLSEFPKHFQSWHQISIFLRRSEFNQNSRYTGIHAAAGLPGLYNVTRLLLNQGAMVDVKDDNNCTALHYAAMGGHVEVVKLLLDRGAQIEAKINDVNWTALHFAAQNEHVEVAKLLLDQGAQIEAKDINNGTPLHWAAANGHDEVAKLLLDQGAQIEAKDVKNWTPLHCVAHNGHAGVAKLFLDRGAQIEAKNTHNGTALHWAAANGHVEVAKLLLNQGAQIEAKDNDNQTALHHVAWHGHVEVTKLLLNQGAQIQAKNIKNWTALHCAAANGHAGVAKLLLDRGAQIEAKNTNNETALHWAAASGHCEMAKLLLDQGAQIEAKDNDNQTTIHFAARNGHVEVTKLLLNQEAQIEAKINDNCTALHLAAESGHVEVIKLLLNQGAQIEAKNINNWTTLHYATQNGHVEVAKLLLDRGAQIEAKNTNSVTALHWAAANGHVEVAKLLLDQGAQIEAKDIENWTQLHCAAGKGHVGVAKLLLSRGAQIEAKINSDYTALHLAAQNGHIEVVKLLLDQGAQIEAKGDDNWTALLLASKYEHEAIVQLLLERGAKTNSKARNIGTALHLAASTGQEAVVELLLKKEAGINVQDEEYENTLQVAAYSGNEKVVQTLLEKAADISLDNQGKLLQAAVEGGSIEIWRCFRDLGWTSSGVDSDGWSLDLIIHQSNNRLFDSGFPLLPQETLLPQSWVQFDGVTSVDILTDTKNAVYQGVYNIDIIQHPISLRADHPFPPRNIGAAYFEVEIVDCVPEAIVGIGFCGENVSLYRTFPGWAKFSWGYHGDDGKVYDNGTGKDYGPNFGKGDTVGCGVNWQDEAFFFTLNGKFLGNLRSEHIFRKLYPFIGMVNNSSLVRANFGGPFVWVPEPTS